MFPSVPPHDDSAPFPPPSPRPPPETIDISRPGRRSFFSRRMRIVGFALFGGGIASVVCGGGAGLLAWIVMPPGVVPFPSVDRFSYYSDGQRFLIWPFALTLFVAPFMFLIFAMAGSAQAIAASLGQGSHRRADQLDDDYRLGGDVSHQR
jgi:hypothetical protein